MNEQSHDYSRHTVEELGNEVSYLDAKAHPERAKALQRELFERLRGAQGAAKRVASSQAVAAGAEYDQLDAQTRRRFFWPYFGFSIIFGVSYSFVLAFAAAFIGAIVMRAGGLDTNPTKAIQIGLGLLLAVPMSVFWLRQVTKRRFGGHGLRILSENERDVV